MISVADLKGLTWKELGSISSSKKSRPTTGMSHALKSMRDVPLDFEALILDYTKKNEEQLTENIKIATEKLLNLNEFAKKRNISIKDAFMRIDGFNLIELLITIPDTQFNSEIMISLYQKAHELEEIPGTSSDRKILFNFSGQGDDFDNESVFADGYHLKFNNEF